MLFFFSSRRRHTRSKRDWSSDVCSSDLLIAKLDYFIEKEKVIFEPIQTQRLPLVNYLIYFSQFIPFIAIWGILLLFMTKFLTDRSEERRVGKECICGWSW